MRPAGLLANTTILVGEICKRAYHLLSYTSYHQPEAQQRQHSHPPRPDCPRGLARPPALCPPPTRPMTHRPSHHASNGVQPTTHRRPTFIPCTLSPLCHHSSSRRTITSTQSPATSLNPGSSSSPFTSCLVAVSSASRGPAAGRAAPESLSSSRSSLPACASSSWSPRQCKIIRYVDSAEGGEQELTKCHKPRPSPRYTLMSWLSTRTPTWPKCANSSLTEGSALNNAPQKDASQCRGPHTVLDAVVGGVRSAAASSLTSCTPFPSGATLSGPLSSRCMRCRRQRAQPCPGFSSPQRCWSQPQSQHLRA